MAIKKMNTSRLDQLKWRLSHIPPFNDTVIKKNIFLVNKILMKFLQKV
jgi:hypothetical protein